MQIDGYPDKRFATIDALVDHLYEALDGRIPTFREWVPRSHELYRPLYRRFAADSVLRMNLAELFDIRFGRCRLRGGACRSVVSCSVYGANIRQYACISVDGVYFPLPDDEVVLFTSRPALRFMGLEFRPSATEFDDTDDPGVAAVLPMYVPVAPVVGIIVAYLRQYAVTWGEFRKWICECASQQGLREKRCQAARTQHDRIQLQTILLGGAVHFNANPYDWFRDTALYVSGFL